MSVITISNDVYAQFIKARARQHQPALSREEFAAQLEQAYHEFWNGNCSLGQAARQLGLDKVQLIDILDMLGWKVANG